MNKTLGTDKTFIYTPAQNVAAGEIVVCGKLIGVAPYAIAAGTAGAVERCREVQLAFDGAAAASQGAVAYLNSDKVVTVTAEGNTEIGVFSVAAAEGASECCIFLK